MMKWIKRITLFSLLLLMITASTFLVVGYMHFHNKITELPLEKAVARIENQAHYTTLDLISDDFEKAIVTIEDIRFYDRYGVDLISIARAFVNGLESGSFNEGGSTITQQLAKNIYFSFERSLIRKCAEIFMTHAFEKDYSKAKILELYVNAIYYGDGYTGIYEASMGYYQVEPGDLTLAQSAVLASLPQSPSVYQLSTGFEYAKKRQEEVLDKLLLEEVIDQNSYNLALTEDVSAK